jgi:hypothetical protein
MPGMACMQSRLARLHASAAEHRSTIGSQVSGANAPTQSLSAARQASIAGWTASQSKPQLSATHWSTMV